jgi:hypothetical protein
MLLGDDKNNYCILDPKRVFENFFLWYITLVDPPKSPFLRGTLRNLAPFFKGGWGDLDKF